MIEYTWGNEIGVPGGVITTPGVSQEYASMTIPQHTPTPENEQEEWRPVVGYEGLYEVSNLGRVRRSAPGSRTYIGKILTPEPRGGGYLSVSLYRPGGDKHFFVHILVAAAFIGPCPPKYEVNHKDGNKGNAALENLEYLTSVENKAHALRTGLTVNLRGEQLPQTKLNAADIPTIRASPESNAVLGARYGVHRDTIQAVRNGRNWKHIPHQERA